MDGKAARIFTEQLIRAANKADIVKRKLTYDLLNMGANEFCRLTKCIVGSQDITTVADQASYDLEPDYIMPYLKTEDPRGGKFFVHFNDGTTVHTILFKAYQKVIYDNQSTAIAIPGNFTIHEKGSLGSQVTGTTTSAGALSGGQATLTDSGGGLLTAVNARDIVHNSSKDAVGVALSVTSDTALVTAIFNDVGNPVPWASGDTYVIQPAAIKQLQFDPPTSTAAYTATIHYIATPPPVYSDFGTWRVSDLYHPAFCFYAAHLYLGQDVIKSPDGGEVKIAMGAKYLNEFNRLVREAKSEIDAGLGKTGYSMRKKA